jgi:hypothetical protein
VRKVDQSGVGVAQGVVDATTPVERQRDVEASGSGAVDVTSRFSVAEGLLEVAKRGRHLPDQAVERAELVVGVGPVVVMVVRKQLQGLMAVCVDLLKMSNENRGGGCAGGGADSCPGDARQGVVGGGATDSVVFGLEIEVTLVPVLSLVEVSKSRYAQVGGAAAGRDNRLSLPVTDPFEDFIGGSKVVTASRIVLLAQQFTEEVLAAGEEAQTSAAGAVA